MNTSFSAGKAALGPISAASPQFKSAAKAHAPVKFGFNSNSYSPESIPGMSDMPKQKQGMLGRIVDHFKKS